MAVPGSCATSVEHYRGRWIDAEHARGGARGASSPRATRTRSPRASACARCTSDGTIDAAGHTVLAPVTLERELTFEVDTEEEARAFVDAEIRRDGDRWRVTQPGAQIRVPRVVAAHPPRRRASSRPASTSRASASPPT